jgi:hypothetical protein
MWPKVLTAIKMQTALFCVTPLSDPAVYYQRFTSPRMKFHENMSNGSQVVPREQITGQAPIRKLVDGFHNHFPYTSKKG